MRRRWKALGGDNQTYKHKFVFIFQIFFNWDFFNEYKFEIQIVKTKYKNGLLSYLLKPPCLRTSLIFLIMWYPDWSHKFFKLFFRELGWFFQMLGRTRTNMSHQKKENYPTLVQTHVKQLGETWKNPDSFQGFIRFIIMILKKFKEPILIYRL